MGKLHEKTKDEKEDMQITKEWLMGNCRNCIAGVLCSIEADKKYFFVSFLGN